MVPPSAPNPALQDTSIDWWLVCQRLLERFLPCTSVNTQPEVTLSQPVAAPRTLKVFGAPLANEGPRGKDQDFSPEDLITKGDRQRKLQGRGLRWAVVGSAGSGKTLFLQHLAWALLQRHRQGSGVGLPLWISPAQIKGKTLKEYLWGPWLEQATQTHPSVPRSVWQQALGEGLQTGQFWLLADGLDYLMWDGEKTVQGPLSWLRESLSPWPALPVVVSCRPETRHSDPQGLAGFERYRTRAFSYPEEVEMAIADCLALDRPQENARITDLAQSLGQALANPLAEPLRPYLTSPVRLILCCRCWQNHPGQFPNTRTALYRELTQAFYEWKSEIASTPPAQRQELARLLGELGKELLLMDRRDTTPLSQKEIEQVFGKQSPLLRLALQLGWLIPRGLVQEGAWERGYGFFDPTFQDYFTALAIEDWHFFLDIYQHHYRIFDPKWQTVMGFWLGREDIPLPHKTDFIEALLAFDDKCSPENFYGRRAFAVAALALVDVPDCPHAEAIVEQLFTLALTPPYPALGDWARDLLGKTYRPRVIHCLLSTLKTTEDEAVYRQCCLWLGQWGQGQVGAIAVLEGQLDRYAQSPLRFLVAETLATLQPQQDKAMGVVLTALQPKTEDYGRALQTLSRCAQGHGATRTALLALLDRDLSVFDHGQVLECLAAIAPQDPWVIAALSQRLRRNGEGLLCCQMAETLEKIDPGNALALSVLQRHSQPYQPLDLRQPAIYSLGEVATPSPALVDSLIALLAPTEDRLIRWLAVSSLAKIGANVPPASPPRTAALTALDRLVETLLDPDRGPTDEEELLQEVLQALIKLDPHHSRLPQFLETLLTQTPTEDAQSYAAELLGQIDPGNPTAINTLLRLLKNSQEEYTQRQAAVSLARIDPGNLSALMALINLLHHSPNPTVRQTAAQQLGIVGGNNPAALAALLRTATNPHTDEQTLHQVIKALAPIGQHNKEVAQTLLGMMRQPLGDALRLTVAQTLITSLPPKLLLSVVYQLREWATNPPGQGHYGDWLLFWHCAHHLSYGDFYQAWHQHPIGSTGTTLPHWRSKQWSFFHYLLDQTLKQEAPPFPPCQVIWIDTSQFLSPEAPSIDIYDQMLCQGCPEFGGGMPDSLSKLRLYWHQLQRQGEGQPVRLLIFEVFSATVPEHWQSLLDQLKTFQGAIAVLSETDPGPMVPIPHFHFQDSQMTAAEVMKWLRHYFNV